MRKEMKSVLAREVIGTRWGIILGYLTALMVMLLISRGLAIKNTSATFASDFDGFYTTLFIVYTCMFLLRKPTVMNQQFEKTFPNSLSTRYLVNQLIAVFGAFITMIAVLVFKQDFEIVIHVYCFILISRSIYFETQESIETRINQGIILALLFIALLFINNDSFIITTIGKFRYVIEIFIASGICLSFNKKYFNYGV